MGVAHSIYTQSFPPKTKFKVEDIPDLTGKVVIVTGANTGVGKETAKALLAHNATVYMAARSKEKADQAIQDLKKQTGKEGIFLKLDLGDLKSIKAATEEFLSKEKELHILFNNAGVMMPPLEQTTTQGYDLQFGTNVLGHFYLTQLLLPARPRSAKTSPDGTARVVNTSAAAVYFTSKVDFNTLKDTRVRRKKGVSNLYAQSKLGNILVANELTRRYGDQGIVASSVNPGNLRSDLQRHLPRAVQKIMYSFLHPLPMGALTQLYAGTTPQGAELGGKFLIPWARVGKLPKGTNDPKLAGELWKWMEEQVANV
ncbi:hypothetical protein NLJ89_g4415 [Agrocybe chaxingu]|uniref:NAD(P)-binding protein n=1 Tax=Agrocybe chaxingu TaxID=84603 RepID=A0A9W8MUK8_9AGAR|nr:hypothetical protein NLJ89_g4415 [Agrocybe chaxingu]